MKMNIYSITMMLLCLLLGCPKNDKDIRQSTKGSDTKHEIDGVIDIVNEVFKTQIPYDVNEINLYVEGWQGHGLYVFFSMNSKYVSGVKHNNDNVWKAIPKQYSDVPHVSLPVSSTDFNGSKELYYLLRNIDIFFDAGKRMQIHSINSDKIQWYYSKEGTNGVAPEQVVQMMVSEEKDGFCNVYLADRDIRGFSDREKLYNLFGSSNTRVFKRAK